GSEGVRRRPRNLELVAEPRAHVDAIFGVHDDDPDAVDGLGEREPLLGPEDEHGVVDGVRGEGVGGPDGDTARRRRGIAGARVDDVVVALAVHVEGSRVVAGGAEGAILELDRREERPRLAAWVLDAADPRGAVRFAPRSVEVAAGLNEEGGEPMTAQHARGRVDDVTLGDAAEPQPKSRGDADAAAGPIELDAAVVDARASRFDLLAARHARIGLLGGAELPDVAQHLERDVERALGDATRPQRTIEDGEELGADADPLPGVLVDAPHLAV